MVAISAATREGPRSEIRMSALGQKRTCATQLAMSAKGQKRTSPTGSIVYAALRRGKQNPIHRKSMA
jgi:hypothetical protein